jgi:hypothetical protein
MLGSYPISLMYLLGTGANIGNSIPIYQAVWALSRNTQQTSWTVVFEAPRKNIYTTGSQSRSNRISFVSGKRLIFK